jgi:hypothetical protein
MLVGLVFLTWWIWWVGSIVEHHRKAPPVQTPAVRPRTVGTLASASVDLIDSVRDPGQWTTLDDTQLTRLLRDSAP